MTEKKQGTFLADTLFLIAMTFVLAFPKPSVFKAIAVIAFFTYTTWQSLFKTHKLGEWWQWLWALSFYGICYFSKIWSVVPSAIEEVITNVLWALLVSIGTVNYIRVYKMSVLDIAKRVLFIGVIFSINVLLNGTYVDNRYTVAIGGYILNENVFGQIATGIAGLMIYWSKKNNWNSLPETVFGIIMIIFVLLSGSRKSLIAVAIYFIAFILYEYPPKDIVRSFIKIVSVVAVIALLYLCVMKIESLYNTIGSRIESLFAFFSGDDEADGSAYTRTSMIESAMEMFKNKPILGYGLNAFSKVAGFDTYSHNNYTELLANLGITGTLIYYVPIIIYFVRAINLWKRRFPEIIFAVCNIGIFIISDFASVSYYAMPTHLFLALGIGIVVNVSEKRREELRAEQEEKMQ